MNKVSLSGVVYAFLLCFASSSNATFHTYDISEIFTDATGTIQFIELTEVSGANGQDLFGGQTITMDDGTPEVFTFNSTLPSSSTANTSVLIATIGFSGLVGAPIPDYIMPDNFLSIDGGTLNFANVDQLTYGSLPTDGVTSLFDGGGVGLNSPTNFAGDTGSIAVVPVPFAALLFTSGLFALVGFARHKKI